MPKPKILIAEDNKVTQALFKQGFPETLCERKIVSNGEEALQVYEEWHPDMVILDFSMPVMNGHQALKAIRKNDKKTTIIMVTAMTDKEDIVACAQLGIQGYVVKPFTVSEIAPKVFGLHSAKNKAKKN